MAKKSPETLEAERNAVIAFEQWQERNAKDAYLACAICGSKAVRTIYAGFLLCALCLSVAERTIAEPDLVDGVISGLHRLKLPTSAQEWAESFRQTALREAKRAKKTKTTIQPS